MTSSALANEGKEKQRFKVSPSPRPFPIRIASRCVVCYSRVEVNASFVGLPMSTHISMLIFGHSPTLTSRLFFYAPIRYLSLLHFQIQSLMLTRCLSSSDCYEPVTAISPSRINLHLHLCRSTQVSSLGRETRCKRRCSTQPNVIPRSHRGESLRPGWNVWSG